MSRGRWFPVPLFLLHAALAPYHLYAALIGAPLVFVAAFLNRGFELALLYVVLCAILRIRLTAEK